MYIRFYIISYFDVVFISGDEVEVVVNTGCDKKFC